jgi:hypothetical protein
MKQITRQRIKLIVSLVRGSSGTSKSFVLTGGTNKHMKKQFKRSARLIGAFALALSVGMAAVVARADDALTEQ